MEREAWRAAALRVTQSRARLRMHTCMQVSLVVNNPFVNNAGGIKDPSLIPWLGRSPEGGHGIPLQYSCLENPVDREAWSTTAHSVAKSQI